MSAFSGTPLAELIALAASGVAVDDDASLAFARALSAALLAGAGEPDTSTSQSIDAWEAACRLTAAANAYAWPGRWYVKRLARALLPAAVAEAPAEYVEQLAANLAAGDRPPAVPGVV